MNRWVFVVVLHELKQAHGRQHRWVSPRWCSPWIERNRTTPRLTHRPHWIMWWGKFLIVSIIGKTKGPSVCCCSEMARISRQSQISTKKHSPGFKHYLLTILSWSLLTSYNQLDAIFGVVTWCNNCAGKRNIISGWQDEDQIRLFEATLHSFHQLPYVNIFKAYKKDEDETWPLSIFLKLSNLAFIGLGALNSSFLRTRDVLVCESGRSPQRLRADINHW